MNINGGEIDNTAIGVNAKNSGAFTILNVDNLKMEGNAISSTNANGNIDITPNGSGEVNIPKVNIDAGTIDGVTIGTNNVCTELRVDNLKMDGNTIFSTNANGNIDFTPNGTGEVNISKVNINGGEIDNTAIGVNTKSSGAFTTLFADSITLENNETITNTVNGEVKISSTNLVVGTGYQMSVIKSRVNRSLRLTSGDDESHIQINKGTDGNIGITPSGSGEVNISNVDIDNGKIDGVTIGTNNACTDLRVDNLKMDESTISSTNTNGDIYITPNGTGRVLVPTTLVVTAINLDSTDVTASASEINILDSDINKPTSASSSNQYFTNNNRTINHTLTLHGQLIDGGTFTLQLNNSFIKNHSIVFASSGSMAYVIPHTITNGSCKIDFTNKSGTNFAASSTHIINIVIF